MNKVISIVIVLLSFCIVSFSQVNEFKLLPSTGSENDHFGRSVSIDGEYAIVGASGAEKVFVFKKSGINWIEEEILIGDSNPPGSTLDPLFGFSVSISGSYAIVGAPFHVEPPWSSWVGAAYIFKRNGENWVLQGKILSPDGWHTGLFGWSVAISDTFAVIGEANRSSAYIYRRIEENWFLDITLSHGYRFGESVAISDDYISIGTVGGSRLSGGQGSAYIFFNNGVTWSQQAWLQASDGSDIDGFGEVLSMSNTNLIAGDRKEENSNNISTGAAYIFNREDTSWVEKQKLTASDGSLGDLFGLSVSISGDYTIIAAPEDQDKGTKSGSAYIFMNDGVNWIEKQKLLASDGDAYDNFGSSVSISGNYVIVGADGNDDNGNNSGSAYIYSDFVVSVENEKIEHPLSFRLHQNYPNPFNPSTVIKYQIPIPGFVILKVYDVLGNEIATLVNEEKATGSYEVNFSAKGGATNLSSGIYFYKLQAGSFVETKKMILMK